MVNNIGTNKHDENPSKKRRKRLVIALITAVIFIILLFLLRAAYKSYLRKAYPNHYSELVLKYSAEYDFEPSLIYAIIHTESSFKQDALSRSDAKGLMQMKEITYDWARYREERDGDQSDQEGESGESGDLFDPETNIKYGVLTLSLLREAYPVEETFVAAYNAGYGSVRDWLADPERSSDGKNLDSIPYPETENYVVKVRDAKAMYEKLY